MPEKPIFESPIANSVPSNDSLPNDTLSGDLIEPSNQKILDGAVSSLVDKDSRENQTPQDLAELLENTDGKELDGVLARKATDIIDTMFIREIASMEENLSDLRKQANDLEEVANGMPELEGLLEGKRIMINNLENEIRATREARRRMVRLYNHFIDGVEKGAENQNNPAENISTNVDQ